MGEVHHHQQYKIQMGTSSLKMVAPTQHARKISLSLQQPRTASVTALYEVKPRVVKPTLSFNVCKCWPHVKY